MRPIPDTILTGARIRTMDPARPHAQALAIAQGRVLAAGSVSDIAVLAGPGTRTHHLGGRCVMPGLIDAHAHPLWGACRDLFEVFAGLGTPLPVLLDLVATRAAQVPPGTWIIGGPWQPFRRGDLGARPADLLDRITPHHPVALKDASQHSLWVNSAALALAGIGPGTADIPGGEIERGPDGTPTGILIEAATSLVQPLLAPSAANLDRAARHASAYFHSLGITGVKEAMAFEAELAAYAGADADGALKLHVAAHLTRYSPFNGDFIPFDVLSDLRTRYGHGHIGTDFAKLFLDGVPISRTAAFTDPYPGVDSPHDAERLLLIPPDRLAQELIALDAAGFTVKMHAAGDRAIQAGLDAIAAARAENGPSGLRHEIAHTNFVRPQDLPRFAALGAVAEVSPKLWFPNPVTPGQRQVLGPDRADRIHPIAALLRAGAEVIYGSDWPAAAPDADPWVGLAGMLTRADPTGRHPGFVGRDQAISLDTALPLFTTNGARSLGLDGKTGALVPGASADLIVLPTDPADLDAPAVAAIRPLATLFEGRVVYGAL